MPSSRSRVLLVATATLWIAAYVAWTADWMVEPMPHLLARSLARVPLCMAGVGLCWAMAATGKIPGRPESVVAGKRATAERALRTLDRHLAASDFMVGSTLSIADISIYAYAHLADDAGVPTSPHPAFCRWMERVRSQPGHLPTVHLYSIDPHAVGELP